MKGVVFEDGLALRDDLPAPERGPGEALIRPTRMGVCNTDLELVKGYMGFRGVLGHEFVGVVEAADDPAWIGRRVCGDINAACADCDCALFDHGRQGDALLRRHHCPKRSVLGIQARDGAFAEQVVLPARNLYAVPDGVSDDAAVFCEPLAAAFEIPAQLTLKADTRAVVLGDGKLGLLCALVLRLSAASVTLVGRHRDKLAIAEAQGVSVALEGEATRGAADLVVEATGSAAGLATAMTLVRPRGTIVLKSTVAAGHEIDLAPLVIHEVALVGSRCGPMDRALEALDAGQVDPTPLITARYPLAQGDEAVRHAAQRGTLKVLIEP